MILESVSNFALPLGSTGAFFSTDVAEVDPVVQSIEGEGLSFGVQISDDVTSDGAASVEFVLASDSTGNIPTDGSAARHFSTGPIPVASLVRGAEFGVALSPGPFEKYIGLFCRVTGAALTGGRFNASITPSPASWTA